MIKLAIFDIDGVLTDGTKVYDKHHSVLSKKFMCKDFTAIKRFIASGVRVVMVSGDQWNREMARKRNIEFYCSRDNNLSLDKSVYIDELSKKYNIDDYNMMFVGDDYFDLSMFKKLKYTFCPSDAPEIIKKNAHVVCNKAGGEGVIVEIYDYCINTKLIIEADPSDVAALDKNEITSKEMK